MPEKMQCDCCKQNDLNEVLILRKKNFTYEGKEYDKYHRVCFGCAKKLVRTGVYNIGDYWCGVFNWVARVRQ